MRLTKGVYDNLTFGIVGKPNESMSGLFGLYEGQIRGSSVVHNGGWYNNLGEKIGWGDLSEKDLQKISRDLKSDEAFIVLGEHESFWNFVTHYGVVGALCQTKSEEQNPGLDYVIKYARYAIFSNQIMNLFSLENSNREDLKLELKKRLDEINVI